MNDQRFRYEKDHFAFQCGVIGGLQTISMIEITAGDRVELEFNGIVRLSPLRRNLVVDCMSDIFAFWVPHRHSLGVDWINFMKQGVDETITFTGVTLGGGSNQYSYLGYPYQPGSVLFKPVVAGYNAIWNRYFRHPTADGDEIAETAVPTDADEILFGKQVCYLPHVWNTPIDGEVDASDLEVSTAGSVLDLTELAQQKARLYTERQREFFAQRYNDVLARTFGTNVNIDADERPEMLGRLSQWLSGYDVDGTDAASLGSYSGKSMGQVEFRIPRRQFSEHGFLWIMATMRFPSIHHREMPYLAKKVNPTYAEISGDPNIIANEPPEVVDLGDYFDEASGAFVSDAGIAPYGQHYRFQPNAVHTKYDFNNGFAFVTEVLNTKNKARYINGSEYDPVFRSQEFGHWQAYGTIDLTVDSVVPPPEASIFAGSR